MHEDIRHVRQGLSNVADEIDYVELHIESKYEHTAELLNIVNQLAEIRTRIDAVRTDCLKLQPKKEEN